MTSQKDKAPVQTSQRNGIPLRWLIVVLFGGLVTLSVGAVLAIAVSANFANTYSLLEEQAEQLLADMESEIRAVMADAEYTIVGFQRLLRDRALELSNDEAVLKVLQTQLRSMQNIETLAVQRDGQSPLILHRTPDGSIRQFADAVAPVLPLRNALAAETQEQTGRSDAAPPKPVWLGPQIRNGVLFHDVVLPLLVNGRPAGRITASLGGASINRLVASFGRNAGTTAFLLNSENRVIAYSHDPSVMRGQSGIALNDMPDLALRSFPDGELVNQLDRLAGDSTPIKVHSVDTESQGFVFLTREIVMLSPEAYTVGAYFRDADVMVQLQRAARSGFVGMFALIVALAIAIFLARSIARPLDRVADAARRFSELDLDGFSRLPASRIREIDTQASAFNALHNGLTQFSRYVPQVLVRRILESGPEATRPVEREITVMFADIAEFTALSEPMDADAIVELLNEVFAIISGEVAATFGTVDKYLGDGVMAFWGAPEEDARHAANAILAAQRMRTALGNFNQARAKAGQAPIRFRVGLHTGRATVGTIGGADRANYTILGHTVNVASRIEQLIKSLDCADEVCIALSARCYQAAGSPDGFRSVGSHQIRGSTEPLEVLAAANIDNGGEQDRNQSSAPMAN